MFYLILTRSPLLLIIIPSFLAESYCSLYWLQSAESSIFMHDCSKHGVFINSFYHSGHLCPHQLVHRFIYSQNLRLSSNQHSEKKKKSLLLSRKKKKTFSLFHLQAKWKEEFYSLPSIWLHTTQKHSTITKLKMTLWCSLQQHICYNWNDSEKINMASEQELHTNS